MSSFFSRRRRSAFAAALLAAGLARAEGPQFQIVESVPQATRYGEPGVARTQDAWLAMIRGARRSIDIAAFYITDQPGEALAPVLDALVARARAGVKVRLLLDESFMHETQASLPRLRGVPNLEIQILPVDKLTGGVLHAKYMVVDEASVFVGSQNWDWRALDQIHEIGARIDEPRFARTFAAAFDFDWNLALHPDLPKARARAVEPPDFAPATAEAPVVLRGQGGEALTAFPAFSPPVLMPAWVTAEQPALVRLIDGARRSLRIQVMTLTAINDYGPKGWWPQVDTAIRAAAARGVEVEIIVADWALREPMQAYLKSLAVLPHVAVKFSSLPPAPRGFIPYARVEHCKYAVADDDRAYIGTGNWSWSYFNTTVDASVFVQGRGPALTLSRIFDRDWNGSYVTVLDVAREYPAAREK
jgi:phosphatidylserine/phosphatidylglycerophosphate/cardiolipin synthase-like enzyme